jgi:hypothetical protein
MLHCLAGMSLFPVPIAAGAVRILVLRTLKISHGSVVCVAVTTRSVDKMSPYVFFFRTKNGGTRLAFLGYVLASFVSVLELQMVGRRRRRRGASFLGYVRAA